MDQHLSYYSMSTRRTLKWWKKVFWRLEDICIINAWILFRQNNPNSAIKSQRSFRLKLAEELVQPLLNLKANPSCPPYLQDSKGRSRKSATTEKRLTGKHFAYKSKKRSRCVVCRRKYGKQKDVKTQNFCPKCDVFLCQGDCFEQFHTRTSY